MWSVLLGSSQARCVLFPSPCFTHKCGVRHLFILISLFMRRLKSCQCQWSKPSRQIPYWEHTVESSGTPKDLEDQRKTTQQSWDEFITRWKPLVSLRLDGWIRACRTRLTEKDLRKDEHVNQLVQECWEENRTEKWKNCSRSTAYKTLTCISLQSGSPLEVSSSRCLREDKGIDS